jgi:bacterioferritin
MKGNATVLAVLADVLAAELTAINQYFLHARMLKNWGFQALAAHVYEESIDEMKHADALVERILFLDGLPNLQKLGKLCIGENVKEQFENDLAMEYDAIARFNKGIATCRNEGDHGSEELLRGMLVSEENHTDWLETQLELIKQVGLENYLAEHIRK